ncbi:MAG: TetR/AcrR family transcriptional regulator [Gemmataceae bacterium]|nr:TetR/AcrR family transcriptional regulator [Gemmata sp.]MDW8197247.1 TetR/AcrR family transcriptional regulator [Gemmataceae bacterium]
MEGLSEIAQIRREQILDAAETIIARHGIQMLSLGRIESEAGMSRGQLTYYFPTKESILLAVYDRMLRRMIRQALASDGPKPMTGQAWQCLQHGLKKHLAADWPPPGGQELFSLLYTFLAQMGHRDDYRKRLSQWYAEWRSFIARDIETSVPEPRVVSPQVLAALIQALVHGLDMQMMLDPNAFDRHEMFAACVRLLAPLFASSSPAGLENSQPVGEMAPSPPAGRTSEEP